MFFLHQGLVLYVFMSVCVQKVTSVFFGRQDRLMGRTWRQDGENTPKQNGGKIKIHQKHTFSEAIIRNGFRWTKSSKREKEETSVC